jgi:hypothetical protein
MGERFSKGALIEQMRERASRLEDFWIFDRDNGKAQLCSRSEPAHTLALVERAVEYGRWRTLRDLAREIEDGSIGVRAGQATQR